MTLNYLIQLPIVKAILILICYEKYDIQVKYSYNIPEVLRIVKVTFSPRYQNSAKQQIRYATEGRY